MTEADLRSDETKAQDERVDRAVAAERERCAKLAEQYWSTAKNFQGSNYSLRTVGECIATAIRKT